MSTLLLLLCGLLKPRAGRLLIDQRPIDGSVRSYRSRFAGVFGDCHLFMDVLNKTGSHPSDGEVGALLKRVKLDSRVDVVDGSSQRCRCRQDSASDSPWCNVMLKTEKSTFSMNGLLIRIHSFGSIST